MLALNTSTNSLTSSLHMGEPSVHRLVFRFRQTERIGSVSV